MVAVGRESAAFSALHCCTRALRHRPPLPAAAVAGTA
eukprot:CAMPEP_0194698522 /NCGR_PEP_ID=MMETSP0295-20121207/24154_1 /TAXON_ID=39354 /ORGANISM="Heterosigma akashiwo, Strain CCMP2393" /LENGTH=36 /DNA_ID= /DNA_START= /DNA_END= /DNA_ORIENTATION=